MKRLQQPRCVGVSLTVKDKAGAAYFYREILGFQETREGLHLGDFNLVLNEAKSSGRSMPADSRSNDHWFRHLALVVRNMDVACEKLLRSGVEFISAGPQTLPAWNKDAAGIEALYFQDPEGHPLELIHFPPNKGNQRWHEKGQNLFQGVDHTAIVVSRTDESLRFYCDGLGFRVTGKAHNSGVEQEALSAVHLPSVRITTLGGSGSCGIELLEYEYPVDGRPQPAATNQNDLWWATTNIVSPDPRHLENTHERDPDGHGVQWI